MSTYKATVIKTGNSYALRVPIQYVKDAQLSLGEKVEVALPTKEIKQNRKEIQRLFKELQEMKAFSHIKDPVVWQRQIRKDRPLPDRD